MPEEKLDIVINARDYATATLEGVSGRVKELGASVLMTTGNFSTLTRELGIQIPLLEGFKHMFHTLGLAVQLAGSAMKTYQLLASSTILVEWAHVAVLKVKALLMAIASAGAAVPAMIGAAAVVGGLVGYAMGAQSMQRGGVVTREGLYYLHPGEVVTPAARVTNTQITQNIRVSLERPVLTSEVDLEKTLDYIGRRVAVAARQRGG